MNSRMQKGMLLMTAGVIACILFVLINKFMTPDNEKEVSETTESSQTTIVTVSPDKKPILNFGKGNAGKSTMVVISNDNDKESQTITESETEESETEATEALKNARKPITSMISTVGMLVSCLLVITGAFNLAMGLLHPLEP